jgi:hypothetical protein
VQGGIDIGEGIEKEDYESKSVVVREREEYERGVCPAFSSKG